MQCLQKSCSSPISCLTLKYPCHPTIWWKRKTELVHYPSYPAKAKQRFAMIFPDNFAGLVFLRLKSLKFPPHNRVGSRGYPWEKRRFRLFLRCIAPQDTTTGHRIVYIDLIFATTCQQPDLHYLPRHSNFISHILCIVVWN